jgi:hypothetical protein
LPFNETNTPMMGYPDTYLPDGRGNFGVVTYTANTQRELQMALKFYFSTAGGHEAQGGGVRATPPPRPSRYF